jgi:hypothetical protein
VRRTVGVADGDEELTPGIRPAESIALEMEKWINAQSNIVHMRPKPTKDSE